MGCTFSPGNGRYLIRGTGTWTEGGATFRTTIGGAFVELQLFIIRAPAEFCLPVKKKLFNPGFQVMVCLALIKSRTSRTPRVSQARTRWHGQTPPAWEQNTSLMLLQTGSM